MKVCLRVFACVCVCLRVFECVCVCLRVCVCLHVFACVCMYFLKESEHVDVFVHVCMCMCVHVNAPGKDAPSFWKSPRCMAKCHG